MAAKVATVSVNQSKQLGATTNNTRAENKDTIRYVLKLAMVGLQPIDQEDIIRNTQEGDTEDNAISNAVNEFLATAFVCLRQLT